MSVDYKNAKKIAEQITDVMQSKEVKNDESLRKWMSESPYSKEVIDKLIDEERFDSDVKSFDKSDICEKSIAALKRRILRSRRMKNLKIASLSIAAALIAISMLVWTGMFNDNVKFNHHRDNLTAAFEPMSISAPLLVLDDGQGVSLDTVTNGISDLNIEKKASNRIKYAKLQSSTVIQKFNTLIIPSKFTYSIELSDGTKVLLNANSKLVYPVAFNQEVREVTLEGEAFFDVAKNDIPFVVKTQGVDVRVYGTKFNVNSYDKEKIETVLLSGSVGVSFRDRDDILEQMLEPNQLSVCDLTKNSNKVSNVDAAVYVAWVDGVMKSYDTTLGDLIKKMEYWYGVEFEFYDKSKFNIPVTASFKMAQSIESVIKAIEYSTNIKIKKTKGGYIVY